MPTTVYPAPHGAKAWANRVDPVRTAEDMLKGAFWKGYEDYKSMIQSSFKNFDEERPTFASDNGFVRSALLAYNAHYRLTIRPEDVWFSILAQLATYINARAEELRAFFVSHEGRKTLEVNQEVGHRSKADMSHDSRYG